MNILVNNQADLAKKYVRNIKWRMHKLREKFDFLLYVEIYLKTEGNSPTTYEAKLKLGLPGHDIILKNKADTPEYLFHLSAQDAHRYLAKLRTSERHKFA